jgi:prepilin-type N-terminal cleavage/methylation domain-containing protein
VSRLRSERGFTFVEMLVALALTGILVSAFMGTFASTLHWGGEVEERSVLQAEARAAVDGLAAELRQSYTGDTTALVETATPTTLTFNSPDRLTPMHLRRIAYRLSGRELQRSVTTSTNAGGAPWTFPAQQGSWVRQLDSIVGAAVFSYTDSSGVATADPAKVKTVTISVTLATNAAQDRRVTYRTAVTLRGAA